ncbi:hypothetical protein KDH_12680 [Dictyobacter sp. S3.2.2.5]|uniref:Uncharacterized protein n=1 Tax=Dictyobacter halimunensis TaxID=3026934 RepID=A0ABQ6FJM2_9CHLR|nr:hypothetical protein KDH_12680 [Dictyobacter sp. S3.2.2.5]
MEVFLQVNCQSLVPLVVTEQAQELPVVLMDALVLVFVLVAFVWALMLLLGLSLVSLVCAYL